LGGRNLLIATFTLLSVPMIFVPVVKSPVLFLCLMFVAASPRSRLRNGHVPCHKAFPRQLTINRAGRLPALYGIGMWVGPMATGMISESYGMGRRSRQTAFLALAIAALLLQIQEV
jgi:hypothetical protein